VVGYYDEVRTRLLESRGMQVIEADAGEFLPLLAKRAAAG
jgi:L-lactate utilization protein LutB